MFAVWLQQIKYYIGIKDKLAALLIFTDYRMRRLLQWIPEA